MNYIKYKFYHHPMIDSQPVLEQRLWNPEIADFLNFTKLLKKTELVENVELPDQRGFELRETREEVPAPWPAPIHKLSMMSVVRNMSVGQLGWLSGYAPSQLLHTCCLAEYGKPEKALNFLATTENIGVINSLLILNPNHSSYWEED